MKIVLPALTLTACVYAGDAATPGGFTKRFSMLAPPRLSRTYPKLGPLPRRMQGDLRCYPKKRRPGREIVVDGRTKFDGHRHARVVALVGSRAPWSRGAEGVP